MDCYSSNRTIALVLIAIISPSLLASSLVTVDFTADFKGGTSLQTSPPVVVGGFISGDQMSGSYTYDTAITDSDSNPSKGVYPGALTEYTLDFGKGFSGSLSSAVQLFVGDSTACCSSDVFRPLGTLNATGPDVTVTDVHGNTGSYRLTRMSLSLGTDDFTVLSSDALIPILPTAFTSTQFDLIYEYLSGSKLIGVSGQPLDILQISAKVTQASFHMLSDPPIANAGDDITAAVGETAYLNGAASTDDETVPAALGYQWVLTSQPSGSTAQLSEANSALPFLTPDLPGVYLVELTVTDADGLQSAPDVVSIDADLSPAFIFERLSSGSSSWSWGPFDEAYSNNYWHPFSLSNGSLYGIQYDYQYQDDWLTGTYFHEDNTRIGVLSSAGESIRVSHGDPVPDTTDAIFYGLGVSGNIGDDLIFSGWGYGLTTGYTRGLYKASAVGVTSIPSVTAPVTVVGEDLPLSSVWPTSNQDFDMIYRGTNGSCHKTSYTYTYDGSTYIYEYCSRYHTGLYLIENESAQKIADIYTAVPDSTNLFEGFGQASRDRASGRIVFVGYWYETSNNTTIWHQGLIELDAQGSLHRLLDDTSETWNRGRFDKIRVNADAVYIGGIHYDTSGYDNGHWWSNYKVGIYRLQDGQVSPEVEGGSSSEVTYNANTYEYHGLIANPSTWNFQVANGVLAFQAITYQYSYTNNGYSKSDYNYGTFWKENGRVRKIGTTGDTLAGTKYDHISPAGYQWLDGRTVALMGQNYTSTYDSDEQRSSSTATLDVLLARFDTDRDGVGDDFDNCPDRPNADQADSDGNGVGDVCEDTDADGYPDVVDNCPVVHNDQSDSDGDHYGDACDVCPHVADDQSDSDGDGIGDACDNDKDNDTVVDNVDNCPAIPNTDQADMDGDGAGDACDLDIDGDGIANAVDGTWDGATYTDESRTSSNNFSDAQLDGRSYGHIVNRGSLIILIEDAPNADEGLIVSSVNGSGQGLIKQCDFKGKDANLKMDQGSVVTITCGSIKVKTLVKHAQLLLDDDVTIEIPEQTEAHVIGLGTQKFIVANETEGAPFPLDMRLGANTKVSIPTASTGQIHEPEPGQFEIENLPDSAQPITVEQDGVTLSYAPGDIGVPVTINIKPDSSDNSINLSSNGIVPVAILSSATFDATQVDPLSIRLASAPVKLKGKGTSMYSIEDYNGDGIKDLVVKVETSALQLSSTSKTATLTGMTISGVTIKGSDSVKVVPK